MTNGFLVAVSTLKLLLYYGVCFGTIFLVMIIIAIMKHKTKREMRAETIKKSCAKAKKYAQKLLDDKERIKLLGTTKLLKLTGFVEESAWLAFQAFEGKKDIVFEGLAGKLDGLANTLTEAASGGYIGTEDYEEQLRGTIDTLNTVIAKLDELIKK